MKRTLFFLMILLTSFTIKAQTDDEDADVYDRYPRQLGLKIGLNSTTFNSDKSQLQNITADATSKFGFSASAAYWFSITPYFRPRVELSYDVLKSDVNYISTATNGSTFQFAGKTGLSQGSVAFLPEWVFGKHIQVSVFLGFQVSALLAAHQQGLQTTMDSSATVKSVVEVDQTDNTISEGVDTGLLTGFGVRYRLVKRLYINAETRLRFGTSMVYGIYKPYYWGISAGCIYTL
jgi:hypothetical protein